MLYDLMNLLTAVVACLMAAMVGGIAINRSRGWYEGLTRFPYVPSLKTFGMLWLSSLVITGISLSLLWDLPPHTSGILAVLPVFYIQLLLIPVWAFLFFEWKKLWGAFFLMIFLIVLTSLTLFLAEPLNIGTSFLLMPPLVWMFYLAALNFSVARLNPQA